MVAHRDAVATIRFSRPAVLNAIDLEIARAFATAVDDVTSDDAVRVIVLAAEGSSFIAGGGLGYFRVAPDRRAATETLIAAMHGVLLRLTQDKRPVVASLKGAVAGGGVVPAADLAVAADDLRLSLAYTAIAASPDCGSTWSLVNRVVPRAEQDRFGLRSRQNAVAAQRVGSLAAEIAPITVEGEIADDVDAIDAARLRLGQGSVRTRRPGGRRLDRRALGGCGGSFPGARATAARSFWTAILLASKPATVSRNRRDAMAVRAGPREPRDRTTWAVLADFGAAGG